MDPTFAEAWNNLGVTLAELRQHENAVWAYRKAIEIDPNYADAHFNLANCLKRDDRNDAASRR
jgi:Flp pilus assembly protein TadD